LFTAKAITEAVVAAAANTPVLQSSLFYSPGCDRLDANLFAMVPSKLYPAKSFVSRKSQFQFLGDLSSRLMFKIYEYFIRRFPNHFAGKAGLSYANNGLDDVRIFLAFYFAVSRRAKAF
jgi:hypothetical protein